jgi:PAS domain S-box-containing protein
MTKEKKLEKQLTKERNFANSLIESANNIVAVIDQNGVMTRVNNYTLNFLEYSREEISSEPFFWLRFIPNGELKKIQKIIENAKNGQIVKSHQNGWVSKSGKKKIFEWSNSLVFKEDGSMDYLFTVGIDITDKVNAENKLKEQESEFEAIFNTTKDGLAIVDLESKFLEFNEAYREMTGYTREELLKNSCIEMTVPEDMERAKEALGEALEKGFIVNFEKTCHRKNGKNITINMSVSMMPDEKRFLISVKDVTKSKELERELQKEKERAEENSRAKSEFLANMSHEIRTPLNGIIGLTNLALDGELSNEQRDYLEKSKLSSISLLHIINDILDYSKIEAGKLDLENREFDLEELRHNLSNLFGHSIYKKGLDLIFKLDQKIPEKLFGDDLRLMQILTNLLGNAIKFTENGHILIGVDEVSREDNSIKLKFFVEDTGIGIDAETQKKLFQSFIQADTSTTRKYGGTGLGLAISKQLVNLMNGKIWLESRKDFGSSFYFEINLGFKDEKTRDVDTNKFSDKDFLVVDDNAIERELLETILKSWGANVESAEDGEDAYRKILERNFQTILLDWEMPNLDGLSLLERLQKENRDKSPTVLMVTSHAKDKLFQSAKDKNIDLERVLSKPYTKSTLLNTLLELKVEFKSQVCKIREKLNFYGKVLLVEDNEINQMVAKQNLINYGLDVEIANNGEEGLQFAKSSHFDLIFMDLQMPVMDGFMATVEIRKFNRDVPIVALSAAVMQHDKELTLQAGMNDHIAKPINLDEIEAILKKYLKFEIVAENPEKMVLEELISLKFVDISELQKNLQLEPMKIYSMLRDFYKSYKNFEVEISSCQIGEKKYKSLIHKLKGVSGNLQMRDLFLKSKVAENSENYEDLKSLLLSLKSLLNEIEEKINPILENSFANSQISLKELLKLIDDLMIDIEDFNFIESDRVENILYGLKGKIEETELKKIETLFDNFVYDELFELLKDVKSKI